MSTQKSIDFRANPGKFHTRLFIGKSGLVKPREFRKSSTTQTAGGLHPGDLRGKEAVLLRRSISEQESSLAVVFCCAPKYRRTVYRCSCSVPATNLQHTRPRLSSCQQRPTDKGKRRSYILAEDLYPRQVRTSLSLR